MRFTMCFIRDIFVSSLLIVLVSCNQNIEIVKTGESLEEAPPIEIPSGSFSGPGASIEVEREEAPPFVKAFFMHTWVEALYTKPANQNPNPGWRSPLLDPIDGRVWCTDCHVSGQVDFGRIPKQRVPMVDDYENDHEFMIELMEKWVSRLNNEEYGARAKLANPVGCVTCHANDPRG